MRHRDSVVGGHGAWVYWRTVPVVLFMCGCCLCVGGGSDGAVGARTLALIAPSRFIADAVGRSRCAPQEKFRNAIAANNRTGTKVSHNATTRKRKYKPHSHAGMGLDCYDFIYNKRNVGPMYTGRTRSVYFSSSWGLLLVLVLVWSSLLSLLSFLVSLLSFSLKNLLKKRPIRFNFDGFKSFSS